jgi:pimeloyl-ACP methyl ester carboxylesterase
MQAHDYDGNTLRYLDVGQGEPILFIHNAGVSHRLWDYQISHFQEYRRVIAPDLLGYGESDKPQKLYTGEDYVAQVESLVSALQLKKFDLVGCCLGGAIAIEYARRHPGQIRTLSVVTATTPKTISSGLLGPIENTIPPSSRLRRWLGRIAETWLVRRLMSYVFQKVQCGAVALTDQEFRSYVKGVYTSSGQWRVFANTDYSSFRALENCELPPDFPPFLMLWGKNNAILRANAGSRLAESLKPDFFEVWDACGYMLMREQSEQTNTRLEAFMNQTDRLDA